MTQETTSPAPQPMLSPETLKDGPWFEGVKAAYTVRTKPSHPPRWLVPVIGFSIAGILWLLGHRKTAIIGGSIVAAMTLLEFVHQATARKVQKALGIFGAWVAQAIGWILLVPMFLIIGPLSRLFTRVMGADPLGRRMANAPSYWHFGADEKARTKKTGSMFCVERHGAGGRNWLGALVLLGVIGLVASEIVLRVWFGFHNPLLYQHDPDSGYRLRPNQEIVTGRGKVSINNKAMRYPRDITDEKPPGVFRIFLIGDSTLFGGEDLTDEQTYPAIAEAMLNKKYPGKQIEVLPLGTNGWGPHHTLGSVQRYGTYGADLSIIAMSAGNSDRPRYLADSQRYLVAKPRLALQTVVAKLGWDTLRYCATNGTNDYNQSNALADRTLETGQNAFVQTAQEILKTCPECMAEAIPQICYGMNGLEGTFDLIDGACALRSFQIIEPKLKALGVPMRYPQALFVGKGTVEELWRKKDWAHLGVKGHQLFAEYLAGRIEEFSKGFRSHVGLPALPVAAATN
jgi:hypothetical protein